jgi:hypothetical protein
LEASAPRLGFELLIENPHVAPESRFAPLGDSVPLQFPPVLSAISTFVSVGLLPVAAWRMPPPPPLPA